MAAYVEVQSKSHEVCSIIFLGGWGKNIHITQIPLTTILSSMLLPTDLLH